MTDDEIMRMDDEVFMQTQAYRAFGTKQMFIQKIRDITMRRKMLLNRATVENHFQV